MYEYCVRHSLQLIDILYPTNMLQAVRAIQIWCVSGLFDYQIDEVANSRARRGQLSDLHKTTQDPFSVLSTSRLAEAHIWTKPFKAVFWAGLILPADDPFNALRTTSKQEMPLSFAAVTISLIVLSPIPRLGTFTIRVKAAVGDIVKFEP